MNSIQKNIYFAANPAGQIKEYLSSPSLDIKKTSATFFIIVLSCSLLGHITQAVLYKSIAYFSGNYVSLKELLRRVTFSSDDSERMIAATSIIFFGLLVYALPSRTFQPLSDSAVVSIVLVLGASYFFYSVLLQSVFYFLAGFSARSSTDAAIKIHLDFTYFGLNALKVFFGIFFILILRNEGKLKPFKIFTIVLLGLVVWAATTVIFFVSALMW